MGLRGLRAFVQQVKWPDIEKAAEKLILVQRDVNTGITEKSAWLCIQASNAAIYITITLPLP